MVVLGLKFVEPIDLRKLLLFSCGDRQLLGGSYLQNILQGLFCLGLRLQVRARVEHMQTECLGVVKSVVRQLRAAVQHALVREAGEPALATEVES